MAITAFGTNDSQTVKIWSELLMREALKATMFKKFLGSGKKAILQRLGDLEKQAGDQIKYDLLMQMTNSGVEGDNRMRDNEEALVYYQDTVNIDQLRNAHAFRRMSQQRTLHNMRKDAKENLADWYAMKYDDYMFRYLGGDTSLSFAANTGVVADTDHYIVTGDVTHTGTIATDEASLGSNDQIALSDLNFAKEKAKTITPPIRPTLIDGEEYYVVVVHPYSLTDIKLNVSQSTYTKWSDIQMYANRRGLKNPLFTGAAGVYEGCIIFESTRIHSPSSNVYRNLMLGAQAGVFAQGNAYDSISQLNVGKGNMFSWYEDMDDYGNEKGIAAGSIFGMKKTRFNSKDYGCMTMSSYAVKHN